MKKLAIIGTAGTPARYGGFETLAHHLVEQQSDEYDITVYCSKHHYKKEERVKRWKGARMVYLPFNANGAQSIIYDIISIIHALFYADVLLMLGVSGGIIVPFIKPFTRAKIIVNIDGLEWRRDKWSKPIKRFLKFSERLAVRYSDADITDNAAIQRYTAIHYKTLSHLIEYGADHTLKKSWTQNEKQAYPFQSGLYAFKVCRIEPENNVHLILSAFSKMKRKTLVVVGNWDNSLYGQTLKQQFGKLPNIHLLDPIYDQEKLDKLRSNCYVYIHGHSAGGTNPSLVEAMYLGLPVVAYDVSYNQATTENEAFYFKNEEQLVNLLQSKNLLDYTQNREKMKAIAERRYTWEIIAQKYSNLIQCLDYGHRKKSVFGRITAINYRFLQKQGLAHLKRPTLFYDEEI